MPPSDQKELEDICYQQLAKHVCAGKQCIVLLGPELLVNRQGIDHRSYFKQLGINDTIYYPKDNLFHYPEGVRRFLVPRLEDFYSDVGDNVLLSLLSEIPFPLIINTCPDLAINSFLTTNSFHYEYFSAEENNKKRVPVPTSNYPVVYNIFGDYTTPNSLVLSYGDLYDTMKKIMEDNSLPDEIENYIASASSFLFLGFTFESWYYQLVCHKLKIDVDKYSLSASLSKHRSHVLEKHFQIVFTPKNPSQALERLLNECKSICNNAFNPPQIIDSKSLFLSYAWGEEDGCVDRETIVKYLEAEINLTCKGVNFIVDKDINTYGDSINSFMMRIGQGKSIVQIISDKYLKSLFCMTEAVRIAQYSDDNERIFFIKWNDIENSANHYKEFWKNKLIEYTTDIDESHMSDKISLEAYRLKQHPQVQMLMDIYHFIDTFHGKILDTVTFNCSPENFDKNGDITDSKFSQLKEFVTSICQKMKFYV